MEWIYEVSAVWGGMDGSMLLWAAMLSVMGSIAAYQLKGKLSSFLSWAIAVQATSSIFFLSVVLFFTNPFRFVKAPFIPPDGNGLNPLLQNPYMAIHPPMLYLGFTTFSVPFAFCLGALLARDTSGLWVALSRRWSLIAWMFLTIGITLGGHWAYLELGWGGFWAWDPVENASLLPWLTGTAFLHSVMVQERRGMLKLWNVWLIALTYGLTVLGTFLTRSGVVQSVHAFASTDIGWIFLVYLSGLLAVTIYLSIRERVRLAPERKFESLLSREVVFLINNLLFVTIAFATLWGVLFPVFSEAVTGKKQTVGIPFFNAVNGPLLLLLLLLMGIGPLLAYRSTQWAQLKKMFVAPIISAFLVGAAVFMAGITEPRAVLTYSFAVLIIMAVMSDLHRAARAGNGVADAMKRHRNKYAGLFVHIGVAIAAVAIAASTIHKGEDEFTLAVGEVKSIGHHSFELNGVREGQGKNFQFLAGDVRVRNLVRDKTFELAPSLRYYTRNKETTTEVALHMGLWEDVYLVLAGVDDDGKRASFKLFVNPLQVWLWFGVFIMAVGTLVAIVFTKKAPAVE